MKGYIFPIGLVIAGSVAFGFTIRPKTQAPAPAFGRVVPKEERELEQRFNRMMDDLEEKYDRERWGRIIDNSDMPIELKKELYKWPIEEIRIELAKPAQPLEPQTPEELKKFRELFPPKKQPAAIVPAPVKELSLEELGKKLFFDPILSKNGKVSCATCHIPERGFASLGKPIGLDGQPLERKAPSLFNRYDASKSMKVNLPLFWDGRVTSLEQQCLDVIGHPNEMGNDLAGAIRRVSENTEYAAAFRSNFKGEQPHVNNNTLATSIARYERTLTRRERPLIDYRAGRGTLPADVERGFNLFRGQAGCYKCHSGDNFTDEQYHNTGVAMWIDAAGFTNADDVGRYVVTKNLADVGKFKTPGLHGVKLHAPYMHDASIRTLEDVIQFYNRGGIKNQNLDKNMKPLNLRSRDVSDLAAFLRAL